MKAKRIRLKLFQREGRNMTTNRATKFAFVAILMAMTGLPQTAEAGSRSIRANNKAPSTGQYILRPVIRIKNPHNSIKTFVGPNAGQDAAEPTKIPDWVKNTAGWWD